jgi:hypothetical protein
MAKKPKDNDPPPGTPYPGSERFADWTLDNIIPMKPGEILVNDDPEGDPHKFARHGEPGPRPKRTEK